MDTSSIKSAFNWLRNLTAWFLKGLISWAGITAILLILFSASLTYFYHYISSVKMDFIECIYFKDKWRNTILGTGTATIFTLEWLVNWLQIKSNLQRQLLNVFKTSLIGTYFIIMLVYFSIITQPYEALLALDGGVFLMTIAVLVNAIIHKIYNDE